MEDWSDSAELPSSVAQFKASRRYDAWHLFGLISAVGVVAVMFVSAMVLSFFSTAPWTAYVWAGGPLTIVLISYLYVASSTLMRPLQPDELNEIVRYTTFEPSREIIRRALKNGGVLRRRHLVQIRALFEAEMGLLAYVTPMVDLRRAMMLEPTKTGSGAQSEGDTP